MDLDNKNALKTSSVFTDKVRLSKQTLNDLVYKAVKKATEEECPSQKL